ncbi:MAG: hypothetical protein WCJ55_03325 [Chloroflexales bacterium]
MSRTIRLFHRWLAPVFIVIMIAVLSTQGSAVGTILQRAQQGMVLVFALSGFYLFALPWWVKWRRGNKKGAQGQATHGERTGA